MKKIIIICIFFLVTGCYNYQEINELAMISTIAIDYQEQYEIIVEVKEMNEQEITTSYLLNSKGQTLKEAFINLENSFDKSLYYPSLDILLVTPTAFETQLKPVLNYLINNLNWSVNFSIMSSDTPELTIQKIKEENKVCGLYLKNILDKKQEINIPFSTFLDDLLTNNYTTIPKIIMNEPLDFRNYGVSNE